MTDSNTTPEISNENNEDENLRPNGNPKAIWKSKPTKLLIEFLKRRKRDVQTLTKRGVTAKKVKAKLWKDASVMLRNHNYKYSPEQCAIKWKNIKRNVTLSKKKFCLKIPV